MVNPNTQAQRVLNISRAGIICLLACTAPLLVGCKDKGGTTAAASNEIKVGEYASLTGDTATFGQSTHLGIQLAIDELKAAGGVNGEEDNAGDGGRRQQAGPGAVCRYKADHAG